MGLAIALFLRHLRGFHRRCWYRLTGRWPRYAWQPMDGPCPLTGDERLIFRRCAGSYANPLRFAQEPGYSRRRQS